jgi:hypothetical protein
MPYRDGASDTRAYPVLGNVAMTHTAWTKPGTYPSIVKSMFNQKCLVSPTCKNTPSGGRMIASMIRKMST